jgi:phosphatidylserine synthase
MFDASLRPLKDRLLRPVSRGLAACRVPPTAITVGACGVGLIAAGFAAVGRPAESVVVWLASRVLDGLDGAVAREADARTDFGGWLDLVLDHVVYAAVPLAVAYRLDDRRTWIAAAVMLGVFYVNTAAWAYLAAVMEKRNAGSEARGETTSVTMPGGVVEGAESIAAYCVFLAWPSVAAWVFGVLTIGCLAGIVQRGVNCARLPR